MRGHDHLALRQELVGHFDGLIERTAGIAPNVEHEPAHTLASQVVQGTFEVAIRVLAEILQLDVGRRRIDHERGRHGRDVHLVARDVERNQLLVAPPPQLDVHRRPLGAAQFLHRLLGAPAFGAFLADLRERVAAAHAFLVGRRSLEDAGRDDVAFRRALDLNAEAVIASFLALAHLRVGFRIEEAGVWIQRAQHAANRAVDQVVGLDRPDVVGLNGVERDRKSLVIWSLVVKGQRAAAEKSADER